MWLLPAMMAVILSSGITINSRIGAQASADLLRVQDVQYPAVEALRALDQAFTDVQDTLRQGVTEGDPASIEASREHAESARAALARLAGLDPGTRTLARGLGEHFERYYTAATQATAVLMGTRAGDPAAAVGRMQDALQALAGSLETGRAGAVTEFRDLLNGSAAAVSRTTMVSLVTALVMLLALVAGSWYLIDRVLAALGGEPEDAVEVVRRIADGDFTTDVGARPGDDSSVVRRMNWHLSREPRRSAARRGRAAIAQLWVAAATPQMAAWARARREPLKSPIAALQPLAMGEAIPGGLRLALALLRGSISANSCGALH